MQKMRIWRYPGKPEENGNAASPRRRILRAFVFHVLEIIALLMVLALVAFAVLAWQLSKGPLDLSFLKEDTNAALMQVFDGQNANIGKLEADWSVSEKSLVIVAKDVSLQDADGGIVLDIPRFEAGLDGLALLRGGIEFSRLVIIGGEISAVRRETGEIGVGVGSVEHVLNNPRLWQQQSTVQAPLLRQALSKLQNLSIRGGALNLKDFRSGIQWRAPDTRISFIRDGERIKFLADGIIESNGMKSPVRFEGTSNTDFSDLSANAMFSNYIPAQLVPDFGRLSFLARVQVPVSSSMSVATDEAGFLVNASFKLDSGAGVLNLPFGDLALESGSIEANFDAETGTISITTAQMAGPRIDVGFVGQIKGLDPAQLIVGNQIDFSLDFQKSNVDMTGFMQGAIELDDLLLQGAYSSVDQSLHFENWQITADQLHLHGNGGVQWVSSDEGEVFPKVQINGRSSGNTDLKQVLSFWPVNLAEGVRSWAVKNMRSANMYDFILQVNVDENLRDNGGLKNEMLTLSFSFDKLETTYFGTMPAIKQAQGTALLRGNSFDVNMKSGRLLDNELSKGYVQIPYLYPAGAMAVYGARASGPLSDLLHIIDQEPFGYVSMYRIVPNEIGGSGFVDFEMHRPMRTRVPFKDMSFSASGEYTNVSASALLFEQDMTGVNIQFQADESRLEIEGQGDIGGQLSKFSWSENFKAVDEPRTKMELESIIDASIFDAFGLPTREYFDGNLAITLAISGNGLAVQNAVVSADLSEAFLDLPGSSWSKPKGMPGSLSFQVQETNPGEYLLNELSLLASGLVFEGQVSFSASSGLQSLLVTRAMMDGGFDFVADVKRDQQGAFLVDMNVASADISPIVRGLSNPSSDLVAVPVKGDIRFAKTIAGPRLLLNSGYLKFEHNGEKLHNLDFLANSDQGEHRFSIIEGEQERLLVSAYSADGGAALEAFLGFDGLIGGKMNLSGEVIYGSGPQTDLVLNLENFQLANTPVAAQILSLGSLRGFADTLSGSGIAFEKLTLPIKIQEGLLSIRGASATGPAMGVTLDGDVNLQDKDLTLHGVLAPAYTLNSMFRSVPIVGNILVPRQGEGVFGLTYSVSGSFAQMQVAVNPLSAFAPGVLRQMFGGSLPETADAKEDQPPSPEEDKIKDNTEQLLPQGVDAQLDTADAISGDELAEEPAPEQEQITKPDQTAEPIADDLPPQF